MMLKETLIMTVFPVYGVNIHGHRRREIDEAVKKQLDKIILLCLVLLISLLLNWRKN